MYCIENQLNVKFFIKIEFGFFVYSNQLISVLKTFSRKEMTRFHAFVQSPYFNKHDEVRQLAGYLNQVFPKFNEKNCGRETIFQYLYPQQKHDQSQLAVLFTYLLRLLEQFLIWENFKGDTTTHQVLLLSALRERKLYRYYDKKMGKLEAQLAKTSIKDSNYYHHYFLKASEADQYYNQRARHETDHSIQRKQDYLDNYYLSLKLRDACEMQVRSRILRVDYQTDLLETVLAQVQSNVPHYEQFPSIIVYYRIYRMITSANDAAFSAAQKEVQTHIACFGPEEQRNLYNYLQNYCIERINQGQRQYLRISFDLSREQLQKKLLFDEKGYLSQWYYKNMVTAGIRLKEMEWIRQFIDDYKERLHPEVVENAYTFNLASYYYSVNELENVLELLVRVEYSDIRYSLAAKSLLLRTYYDLEEYEPLLSLSRSFVQYLQRNQLIKQERRQGMTHLVRFTQRACLIKTDLGFVARTKSQSEFERLRSDLASTDNVIYRDWLHNKLQELERLLQK